MLQIIPLLSLTSTSLFFTRVSSIPAPDYSGYNIQWQDDFTGPGGTLPSGANWNIITGYTDSNGELETYTSSTANVQLSGGSTLQIVPWRDSSAQAGWTSGRVESTYTFSPAAGQLTMVEASIRFGSNPVANKQGYWPAFWMLGDSLRHGTPWPECGELDALETIDGILIGYGTMHCDVDPGGICGETDGIGSSINIPDQGWHTWRIIWDLTESAYTSQNITWYMDGQQFQQITGARVGDPSVWQTVAGNPLYFIFNMAVGGTWPGYPNSDTVDGYGSLMEVAYVAQYVEQQEESTISDDL